MSDERVLGMGEGRGVLMAACDSDISGDHQEQECNTPDPVV